MKDALPVVKTKKMSIGHPIALGVPKAPDGLVEPDRDVHRQHLVRQRLNPDWFSYRLQQCPQT